VRPPVIKRVGDSEAYKTANPGVHQFYEAMKGNVKGLPTFNKDNTKAWQIYGDAVVKSLMTTADIKAILDDAQKQVELVVQ
ncbi:MAG TPA: ABC transporter substrate-binding protein, partial [Bacilli bacterium]